jgi:hypothetical protein
MTIPRETGSEKSTRTCLTCGRELPVTESAYGSISVGACLTCYPVEPPRQVAAAAPVPRETGTDVAAAVKEAS